MNRSYEHFAGLRAHLAAASVSTLALSVSAAPMRRGRRLPGRQHRLDAVEGPLLVVLVAGVPVQLVERLCTSV